MLVTYMLSHRQSDIFHCMVLAVNWAKPYLALLICRRQVVPGLDVTIRVSSQYMICDVKDVTGVSLTSCYKCLAAGPNTSGAWSLSWTRYMGCTESHHHCS